MRHLQSFKCINSRTIQKIKNTTAAIHLATLTPEMILITYQFQMEWRKRRIKLNLWLIGLNVFVRFSICSRLLIFEKLPFLAILKTYTNSNLKGAIESYIQCSVHWHSKRFFAIRNLEEKRQLNIVLVQMHAYYIRFFAL